MGRWERSLWLGVLPGEAVAQCVSQCVCTSIRFSKQSHTNARPCCADLGCGLLCSFLPPLYIQLLRDHADDPGMQEEWQAVKAAAKKRAAAKIESLTGIKVNPNALFDVQVRAAAYSTQQLCDATG